MEIDYDAENWPDCPTPEEMLRQHVHLIEEENRLLQEELTRYRKNQVKLVDMHTALTAERDKLAAEVKKQAAMISKQNIDGTEVWRQIDGLKRVLHQRETVMRQHGVPDHYFGTTSGDVLEKNVMPKL